MLEDLNLLAEPKKSYNLILTPRLMWIVVREKNSVVNKEDSAVKIDINSLGFVGTIAVKNEESFNFLKKVGPLSILKEVAAKL